MIGTDHSNSTFAQEQRLLEALRVGPVSTVHARRLLDVLHPAGRVMTLRAQGFHILTQRTQEPTDCGKVHSVARYVLLNSKGAR